MNHRDIALLHDRAKRSLDAIETCLAHGRIDGATQDDLRRAANYERALIENLTAKLGEKPEISATEMGKRLGAKHRNLGFGPVEARGDGWGFLKFQPGAHGSEFIRCTAATREGAVQERLRYIERIGMPYPSI